MSQDFLYSFLLLPFSLISCIMYDLNSRPLCLLGLKSLKEKTSLLIRFVISMLLDSLNSLPGLFITLSWRSFIDSLRLSFSFCVMRASAIYTLGLFLDSGGQPCYRYGCSNLSGGTASGLSGIASGFMPLVTYCFGLLTLWTSFLLGTASS